MTAWILSSSVLILLVLLLRFLFRRLLSLRLRYALWALALLRLLCPWSLGESRLSLIGAVEGSALYSAASQTLDSVKVHSSSLRDTELSLEEALEERSGTIYKYQGRPRPELAEKGQSSFAYDEMLHTYYFEEPLGTVLGRVLRRVWIAGMAGTGFWFLFVNLWFFLQLRLDRQPLEGTGSPLPVYLSGAAATPCLFGLLRPAVYLPPEAALDPAALRHVLTHEETHYRHADPFWALLRALCLVLHWYNPLVWLAALLSRQDGELACDEGAVRRLGEAERAAYGKTLLTMSSPGRAALMHTATTMTGGARALRNRLLFLVKKPKTALWALVLSLLIAAAAAGCAFAGAKDSDPVFSEAPKRSDYAAELDPVGSSVSVPGGDSDQAAAAWAEAYAARIGEGLSPGSPYRCRDAESVACAAVAESLLSPKVFLFDMSFAFDPQHPAAFSDELFKLGFYRDDAGSEGGLPVRLRGTVALVQAGETEWSCAACGVDDYWGYLRYDVPDRMRYLLGSTLRDEVSEEEILSALPYLNWDSFPDELGSQGWNELMEALEEASLSEGRVYGTGPEHWSDVYPDDQAYRDMYVMLSLRNTDGDYTEGLAYLLKKQRDYDPETFDRCLLEFPEEEREFYRILVEFA